MLHFEHCNFSNVGNHVSVTCCWLYLALSTLSLQRDAAVARQLFVLLFDGLLKELHDDKEMYTQKVQEAMRNILSTTKYYTAMVMGTVMEIALHHAKYIVLQEDDIAIGIWTLYLVFVLK